MQLAAIRPQFAVAEATIIKHILALLNVKSTVLYVKLSQATTADMR